ncbi:MAG: iron ABC transporter permease [Pseudomonadota bacterium]
MMFAQGPLTPRRLVIAVAASAALAGLCVLLALGLGSGDPGLLETFRYLGGGEVEASSQAVLGMRAWRVLLGLLAGGALAAVGVVLQLVLRNPLADPYVVGVSGGAALTGSLAIILIGQGPWVPPAAFAGAALATFITLGAARVGGRQPDVSVLLVGVVLNSFASAVITFVKTLVAASKAQEVLFWLVGFVGYARPSTVGTIAVAVALSLGVLLWLSPQLHIMGLGDAAAARLGVRVERTRTLALLACSLATGAVVSEVGLIGFVGLIVPHAMRILVGPDPRILLPVATLLGGASLVLVDAGTRLLFRVFYSEPPVGALCAAIGAPLFVILLRRHLRGRRG